MSSISDRHFFFMFLTKFQTENCRCLSTGTRYKLWAFGWRHF